eukprot:maker-scaffold190_size271632-snap-gene-0.22 protein:Tk12370 transcript:maker-scaffold190_size271632-snap-gene-0.22-mRNA-1 annotation:"hypothetical protein BRAFLDRAFT_287482"
MDEFSASFNKVPVIEVTERNLASVWTQVVQCVHRADFIAIDCELSGLGDRKRLNSSSIEERYAHLNAVAQTRSIVALGLSTFRHTKHHRYHVDTFNLLALCSQDYIVEPGALKFLVEHGFDFQKQYSSGLPYQRGLVEMKEHPPPSLRNLFLLMVKDQKPLVVHNGLIDLVYLYQNLYAQLPKKLESFVADLTQMFPNGIYDTKYLTDYVTRFKSSYLEYVFRKEQIGNQIKANQKKPHVKLKLGDEATIEKHFQWIQYRWCGVEVSEPNGGTPNKVCENFANHGHCRNGADCEVSHNIDDILQHREGKRFKGDWNTHTSNGQSRSGSESPTSNQAANQSTNGGTTPSSSDRHRAGFDAFMTGFAFSTFLVHFTKMGKKPESFSPEGISTEAFVNKLYLVSKDFPLNVMKSSFAKYSIGHHEALEALKSTSLAELTHVTLES